MSGLTIKCYGDRDECRYYQDGWRRMKTPEEIKKGLECCKPKWKSDHFVTCNAECPYRFEGAFCRAVLNTDVLAYIRNLEREAET